MYGATMYESQPTPYAALLCDTLASSQHADTSWEHAPHNPNTRITLRVVASRVVKRSQSYIASRAATLSTGDVRGDARTWSYGSHIYYGVAGHSNSP